MEEEQALTPNELVRVRFARLAKPASVSSWSLAPSTRPGKKWMVHLTLAGTGRQRTVHFGDSSMQDYTQHRSKERRQRFHQRFAVLIAKTRNDPLSGMFYTSQVLRKVVY